MAAFNRYIKEPVGKDAHKADPEFTHCIRQSIGIVDGGVELDLGQRDKSALHGQLAAQFKTQRAQKPGTYSRGADQLRTAALDFQQTAVDLLGNARRSHQPLDQIAWGKLDK